MLDLTAHAGSEGAVMQSLLELGRLLFHFLSTHRLSALGILILLEEAGIPIPIPGDTLVMLAGAAPPQTMGHITPAPTTSSAPAPLPAPPPHRSLRAAAPARSSWAASFPACASRPPSWRASQTCPTKSTRRPMRSPRSFGPPAILRWAPYSSRSGGSSTASSRVCSRMFPAPSCGYCCSSPCSDWAAAPGTPGQSPTPITLSTCMPCYPYRSPPPPTPH